MLMHTIINPIAIMGSAFILTKAFQPACNAAASNTAKNTSRGMRLKPL
jgi:hypothetical protein